MVKVDGELAVAQCAWCKGDVDEKFGLLCKCCRVLRAVARMCSVESLEAALWAKRRDLI